LDNKWTKAIDFWFKQVKEGYIVEFVVECNESFNSVEFKFATGPRRKLLEEIPLWIKMLFMEKREWIQKSREEELSAT
jgi:hypothetical protein